jgi:hypothetical protein
MYFLPRYKLDVSGQLHVPAALPSEKRVPRYSLDMVVGRASVARTSSP